MKLFDSLAHPTLTGNWLKMKECASFEQLNRSLDDNDFEGACAVAIDGVEGYGSEAFADACRPYPKLAPVAGYNPERGEDPAADLGDLKDMGYIAIKLHPRFNHLDLDSQPVHDYSPGRT